MYQKVFTRALQKWIIAIMKGGTQSLTAQIYTDDTVFQSDTQKVLYPDDEDEFFSDLIYLSYFGYAFGLQNKYKMKNV